MPPRKFSAIKLLLRSFFADEVCKTNCSLGRTENKDSEECVCSPLTSLSISHPKGCCVYVGLVCASTEQLH